jgi:hypothetical protein
MRRTLTLDLSLAATTTRYMGIPDAGSLKWRVRDIRLISDASISTHASNYYTIAIAGSDGTTAIGSWTANSTGGTALTAGVAHQISPAASTGKAGELISSSGQTLKVTGTKAGAPSDLTGQLLVELEAVN